MGRVQRRGRENGTNRIRSHHIVSHQWCCGRFYWICQQFVLFGYMYVCIGSMYRWMLRLTEFSPPKSKWPRQFALDSWQNEIPTPLHAHRHAHTYTYPRARVHRKAPRAQFDSIVDWDSFSTIFHKISLDWHELKWPRHSSDARLCPAPNIFEGKNWKIFVIIAPARRRGDWFIHHYGASRRTAQAPNRQKKVNAFSVQVLERTAPYSVSKYDYEQTAHVIQF